MLGEKELSIRNHGPTGYIFVTQLHSSCQLNSETYNIKRVQMLQFNLVFSIFLVGDSHVFKQTFILPMQMLQFNLVFSIFLVGDSHVFNQTFILPKMSSAQIVIFNYAFILAKYGTLDQSTTHFSYVTTAITKRLMTNIQQPTFLTPLGAQITVKTAFYTQ